MTSSQSFINKIIHGSSTVIFFTLLLSPLGYAIRVLYSHTLSIEMYGLFYAALALFTLITTYNDLGFGYSVAYLVPKFFREQKYAQVWKTYKYCQVIEVSTSVILSLLLILLASWIATHFFKMEAAKNLIYIFSIYLISNSFLSAIIQLFIGLEQEIYYSSVHLIRLLFSLIFSLMFLFFDNANVVTYSLSWSCGYIISILVYSFFLYKKFGFIVSKTSWDNELFKKMYTCAIPTLLTTSVYSFINFSDTFFLTLFREVTEVGVLNVVLPLASISSIFLTPINNFLLPLISRLMEEDKKKIEILLEKFLQVIPFVSLYFGLFTTLFPGFPISFIFGEKWLKMTETPLSILAIGYIPISLSLFLGIVVSGFGLVKERLRASIYIAILSIILNSSLIYFLSVTGAAIANILLSVFSLYIFSKIIKSKIKFRFPIIFYLKLIAFSLTVYISVTFLSIKITNIFTYLALGIIYTCMILIFGYYLKMFNLDMIKLIIRKGKHE